MITRIKRLWYWQLRRVDARILWPQCKYYAPDHDLDCARAVFAMHAFSDPAWQILGESEIIRQIDALM